MKLRGPGDMFGIRQSGSMEFKLGDIYNDADILKISSQAAKALSNKEIDNIFDKNPQLKDKILDKNLGIL